MVGLGPAEEFVPVLAVAGRADAEPAVVADL